MNVHIADDYQLIVDGFKTLLSKEGINVVSTSSNGIELIEWIKDNNKADVLILDISMPKKNGIEVIEWMSANKIEQKVIIVSSYLQLDFIKSTVGNGAKGFVSKQFAASSIIEALRKVHKGGTFFSTDVQEFLVKECLKFKQKENSDFAHLMLEKSLSKQELNILLLYAQDYGSEKIATELNITKSTIRSYTSRMREKLNISPKIGLPTRLEFLKGNKKK